MSDKAYQDSEKVYEYLDIIEKRILFPVRDTDIKDYCTATLLILFAAIDGLGKLIHLKDNAGPNDRIRRFLDYMGSDYKAYKKQLLELRHSLVHNAINVEAFLCQTDLSIDQHLTGGDLAGFIFVNTRQMFDDVEKAFKRFKEDIKKDTKMMKRAADRLEWSEKSEQGESDPNIATPSPPASVQFIRTKQSSTNHCLKLIEKQKNA